MAALIPSVDADNRAGSNIGIIKDPLTSNAKLIAATLPIPMGWTIGLALSGDDKVLTAAYQGLGPSPGTVFMFNVNEIIYTIEHPEEFYIADPKGENEQSPNLRPHVASLDDFQYYAIDAINPAIGQIAADLYRTGSDQQVNFIVPEGSKTPPIYLGNNTYSVTNTSDWLDLDAVTPTGYTEDLTPTLNWHFGNDDNVQKVNLFVSTLSQGKGLFPWDELVDLDDDKLLPNLSRQQKENLLTKEWKEYRDYNPARIITASWSNNLWTLINTDGSTSTIAGDLNSFTIPRNRRLTADQTYYWGVEAFDTKGRRQVETNSFKTDHPATTSPFSGVTILTHGFSLDPTPTGVPDDFYTLANSIIHSQGTYDDSTGLILRYDKAHTSWIPVNVDQRKLTGNIAVTDPTYLKTLGEAIQQRYDGKQLVLLPEWSIGGESTVPDAGFTEAAADNLFAAIVSLDQSLGGGVGVPNTGQIYDTNGNLIRFQGDLLDSPLHFIGFSRGTVVNSEIIQRLGTFFPQAGGVIRDASGNVLRGDLQMTTIDPHDFLQPNLDKGFLNAINEKAKDYSDFYEPPVQVWSNVTFADNYYQERGNNGLLTVTSATPNGRILQGADVNRKLTDSTGFKHDNGLGNTHSRVLAWYAGTADLGLVELPADTSPIIGYTPEEQPIYDALGSQALIRLNIDDQKKLGDPWYKGNGSAEGVGEGWFFSHLGGGEDLRPHSSTARIDVKIDNPNITDPKVNRGDGVIPTVFNGNFDVGVHNDDKDLVPGWWAVNNGNLELLSESRLVKKNSIGSLADKSGIDDGDKVIVLGGSGNLTSISHKAQLIPDWGSLYFDVYIPNPAELNDLTNYIKVSLESVDSLTPILLKNDEISQLLIAEINDEKQKGEDPFTNISQFSSDVAVDLREVDPIISKEEALRQPYIQTQTNRVGYGSHGFETFKVDIPDSWRGSAARVKIEVVGSKTVYLDNISFVNPNLKLGNPSDARKTSFNRNNYLIEKAQFVSSYNDNLKTINWTSYKLDRSWVEPGIPKIERPRWSSDYSLIFKDTVTENKFIQDYSSSGYIRGHQAANNDRSRAILSHNIDPNTGDKYYIYRDQDQTFLTTNILPEANQITAWEQLETDLNNFVKNSGREAYIVTGRLGEGHRYFQSKPRISENGSNYTFDIDVPDEVWKVVLIPEKVNQGVLDITDKAIAFGVLMNNINHRNERNWQNSGISQTFSINEIESLTGLDFFSEIPYSLQEGIESKNDSAIIPLFTSASLLAENISSGIFSGALNIDSIWQGNVTQESVLSSEKSSNIHFGKVNVNQSGCFEVGVAEIRSINTTAGKVNCIHDRFSKINTFTITSPETRPCQVSPSEISQMERTCLHYNASSIDPFQISINKGAVFHNSATQDGTTQVTSTEITRSQVSTTEIYASQISTRKMESINSYNTGSALDLNTREVSFTSSIALQQFLSSHNFDLQNRTVPSWTEFLQSPTPFNLKVEITDLPTGQLAEATITGYDTTDRPNSGTLTLDINGNNQGWFIDTTPGDNSEFDKQLTETAYQATNSSATGKYDLLTVILHELGHLQGIIKGNSAFDANVKNNTFIGNGFTATLTADGSHLDNTLYPYDLLNTSLKPGIRKLPSQLDLAIINQLYSNAVGQRPTQQNLNAALTAGALYAVENGDFTTTTGWNLQGGTTISNGAATLTETSQKLAQDLIIPTGAKRLQFTIKDNHLVLGDSSKTANDAFEVALLGTNFKPLAGTSQGLNNTDSLLNIQANGTTYKSNKVTINQLSPTSQIVTIDITEITPETQATLYFNLLGFGAKESTVTIDDIKIFSAEQPLATPDNIATNQNTPIAINPIINDSNIESIQIIDRPTHGTLTQNATGQIIYQPNGAYVGTDRFTYIGFDSEGSISNQATVDIVVNNLPPSIKTINIPTSITEGQTIQLSATATDNNENLTYSWHLGDGSDPINGQQITHTFTDNGIYNVILTVTDQNGGMTEQAIKLTVANEAPSIVAINRPAQINEGQPVQFSATATDSGINDTLTYTWNFGDGSNPISSQNATHTFIDTLTYNVVLTVTDKDGATTTKTEIITVDNVLPLIISITKPNQINEGQTVEFKAIATDAGATDTLTYSWNFGDSNNPVIGQNATHLC